MAIHLGLPLPAASSDQPGGTGGSPFTPPYLGLAPDGVYLAFAVAGEPGELLPHPFTLTCKKQADFSLWHFPWGRPRWTLSSIIPSGARTFLDSRRNRDHLYRFSQTDDIITPALKSIFAGNGGRAAFRHCGKVSCKVAAGAACCTLGNSRHGQRPALVRVSAP